MIPVKFFHDIGALRFYLSQENRFKTQESRRANHFVHLVNWLNGIALRYCKPVYLNHWKRFINGPVYSLEFFIIFISCFKVSMSIN